VKPAPGWRAALDRRFARARPSAAPPPDAVVDPALLRLLDRLSLTLGRELITGMFGEHPAARRTAGIEFADYRPYSPGDDLRRVDWQAYARLGTLHLRQAQAEHDTALYVLLDASPSMDYGAPSKWLMGRRLAAACGYLALSHLDALTLAAPGARPQAPGGGRAARAPAPAAGSAPDVIGPLRSRNAAAALFRGLQDLRPGPSPGFDAALRDWDAAGASTRLAIIISDLLLDGYEPAVRRLIAAGFEVTLLHLLSPQELRPPPFGDHYLIDSETGDRLEVHLGAEAMRAYHGRLDAWLAATEAGARSVGARYVLVPSDWTVERVLLDTLRRRGVTA
jgi:uncharacterized protein (DUF58 family)